MLLDQIRPHDPLGVAEKAVVTYAQLERDEKETFASGNDGALSPQAMNSFEIEQIPEPVPSAGSIELARRNAEHAERYFAKQKADLDEFADPLAKKSNNQQMSSNLSAPNHENGTELDIASGSPY